MKINKNWSRGVRDVLDQPMHPFPGSATVIVGLERQIFVFAFPRRSSIFSAFRSQSCRDRPITDSPVHERLDAPEQEIQDFRDTPEPQEVSHGTTHAHPNTEKKKIFHISATDLQGTYVSMLSAIFLGCVLAFFIFKRLHEIYFKILLPVYKNLRRITDLQRKGNFDVIYFHVNSHVV